MFPFQFLERKIKQVKLRAVGNKLDAITPQLSDGVCPTLSPALAVSSRVLMQLTVYICSAFFKTDNPGKADNTREGTGTGSSHQFISFSEPLVSEDSQLT